MTRHHPVICDECISLRTARYLEEMGEEIIRINDGRLDDQILHLAQETRAYIITRDKGFRNYQRLILLTGREKPKLVYEQLQRAKQGEKE